MKKIILILLICLTQTVFAEVNLYIKDSPNAYDVSEMGNLLEGFLRDSPEKNILFYVHGRAKELEKNIVRIGDLEATYNVKVVMLDWDSWSSQYTRPTDNAHIASEYLVTAIQEIAKFKHLHSDVFQSKKITLFCHSMGNVILQDFVTDFLPENMHLNRGVIFDNLVSAGADVPLVGHYEWLTRINFAKRKFVTSNNHDGILLASYLIDLKNKKPMGYKLGLGFDNLPALIANAKKNVDPKTSYIDFSKILSNEHAYFLSNDSLISDIFAHLFNGDPFGISSKLKNSAKINQKNNFLTISH